MRVQSSVVTHELWRMKLRIAATRRIHHLMAISAMLALATLVGGSGCTGANVACHAIGETLCPRIFECYETGPPSSRDPNELIGYTVQYLVSTEVNCEALFSYSLM